MNTGEIVTDILVGIVLGAALGIFMMVLISAMWSD